MWHRSETVLLVDAISFTFEAWCPLSFDRHKNGARLMTRYSDLVSEDFTVRCVPLWLVIMTGKKFPSQE